MDIVFLMVVCGEKAPSHSTQYHPFTVDGAVSPPFFVSISLLAGSR